MSKAQLPITPDTKVAALLDAYPGLEGVLVDLAPVFNNLRNPVLRRTVARVATLDRAAKIADIPTHELVAKLRAEVGQPVDLLEVESAPGGHTCGQPGCHAPTVAERQPCDWLCESSVSKSIDADALLAAGIPPLSKVLAAAQSLPAGAVLAVTVSFRPVPLIEALQQQGFRTHCRQSHSGLFELFLSVAPESRQAAGH